MSEERKPTAPGAGNGAAPIVCTTIPLPPDDRAKSRVQPGARPPDDAERTVMPPEYLPPAS
jgi:hypothetical protein